MVDFFDLIGHVLDPENRYLLPILLVLLSVIHFGLPMIISYDGVHYFTLQKVLSHTLDWNHWDPARNIGFPLLLLIEGKLFASQPMGYLVGSFLRYLTVGLVAYYLVLRIFLPGFYRVACLISILLLVMLNPIIIGYYHTLLTEPITATLFSISVCAIFVIARRTPSVSTILLSTFICLLSVMGYHVKQPYVGVTFYPLFFLFFFSLIFPVKGKKNFHYLGLVVVSLFLILFSNHIWQIYLKNKMTQQDYTRTNYGLFAKGMVSGLYFTNTAEDYGDKQNPIVKLSTLTPEKIKSDNLIPESEKKLILNEFSGEVKQWSSGSNQCSSIVTLYDRSIQPFSKMLLKCQGDVITVQDALGFLLRMLYHHPVLFVASYIKGYHVIMGGYSKFEFYDNMIGKKTFSLAPGESNVFWVPEGQLSISAKELTQSIIPGRVGKIVNRIFGNLADFIYPVVFLFSLVGCFIQFFSLFICRVFTKIDDSRLPFRLLANHEMYPEDQLLLITNFSVFAHILGQAIILLPIDRFSFPAFPIVFLVQLIFVFKKLERAFPQLPEKINAQLRKC